MSKRVLVIEADGGSRGNPGHAGYGAVVMDAAGRVLAERAGYVGVASNNVAEYRGLIAGLEAAREIDADADLQVRMDSKLVVEQMSGRWNIKHPDMKPLALRARDAARGADVVYVWIPRAENKKADALANEAMDTKDGDIRRDHSRTGAEAGAEDGAEASTEPGEEVAPKPIETTTDGAAPPPIRSDLPVATPGNRRSALFTVKGEDLVSPITLVMVRHGVTNMTISGALSGSSSVGPRLNAAGKVQAAKAADAVYRIGRKTWERVPVVTRVIASPMLRTLDTAEAIGRRLGTEVETDDRLKEIDFGEWEGMTGEEVTEQFGDAIHHWRFGEIAPPGGESIPQVGERMDAVLRDIAAGHARRCADGDDRDRAYAVVSHAVAIKSAVGYSLGIDQRQWGSIWPQPASLTMLQLRVTRDGEIAERHLLCLGAPVD